MGSVGNNLILTPFLFGAIVKGSLRNLNNMVTNLDFVLSSAFVMRSLFKRDGVGVATTEDWIAG